VSDLVPRPVDQEALERIIKRAAELQAGERDTGDRLTWDEVRQLGREVGIPERHLQQALLEEQNRSPGRSITGFWNRVVGSDEIEAERVVQGERDRLEQQLAHWMEEHELLALQRHGRGRLDWEPLGGLQAAFKKTSAAVGGGRRPFMLSKATKVSAVFVELEPGYCHVSLRAALTAERNQRAFGGLALAGGGVAGTVALATAGAALPLAVIPVIGVSALTTLIWRSYRPVPERAHLGLERALDHLERGTVKASHQIPTKTQSVIEAVSNEIRKALKS